eukprot:TRINITY_DN67704_c6_g2_i2.p1 TRINITY_DN67704_c6_g2~~TRINITY_DN67704_c6_g2_i2.p1  ORF type:complete len:237 (-),score=133.03 TRINITY_DN67704_c6_g2_i2:72-782(-)
MSDKPWLIKDTRFCWTGYPLEAMGDGVRYYYLLQLGYYFHLVIAQLVEERKKDFWEMFVHHLATITLVLFSYLTNFVRIGTLVLLVHDISDPIMEAAKLANYSQLGAVPDVMFAIFAVVFGTSRLYVYPKYVIYSAMYESLAEVGYFRSWYIFNGLLILLLCLHCFWFYLILRMVVQFVRHGTIKKDARSDTADDSDDDTSATAAVDDDGDDDGDAAGVAAAARSPVRKRRSKRAD